MTRPRSRVPALGHYFDQDLTNYAQERDNGPPNIDPQPRDLTAQVLDGVRLDHLGWDYTPDAPPRALPADGFIIYYALENTPDPGEGCIKLTASARRFAMVLPVTQVISYAIAGYRYTYQGDFVGPKVQPPNWRGVSELAAGVSPPGMPATGPLYFNQPLAGAKNGSNTDFTAPHPIAVDAMGYPKANLFWKGGYQVFTFTNPPPPRYWTLVGQTVRLGQAPLAGDLLEFSVLETP